MKYLFTLISVALLYSSCVKDRIIPPQTVTVVPGSTLIDYWNFNGTSTTIPTFTVGGGNLQFDFDTVSDTAGYADLLSPVVPNQNINAQPGDPAGNALRVRNPCTDFIIVAPTTGYKDIVVSYSVAKSTSGASTDSVFYTTDGVTYTNAGLATVSYNPQVDPAYMLETFNLSSIVAVNNNPNFQFKITFSSGNLATSGNDRFDNITVTGVNILGTSIPVISNAPAVSGTENTSFADTIVATNTPTSFHVTGSLPPGLSIDTTKGIISGTPSSAGTFVDTIKASNAQGTGIEILIITIHPPASLTLIDYWNFNNDADTIALITPTTGNGSLSFDFMTVGAFVGYYDSLVPGDDTMYNWNARNGDPVGAELRVRNPCTDFIITAPTSGFTNIVVSYAVTRTSSGAIIDSVSYTIDGVNYTSTGISGASYLPETDPDYTLESFSFSAIPAVNNNPNFKLKITFSDGNQNTSGNNRFDNLTVEGNPQ